MLPMPPVPETVTVFPLVSMVTWAVPVKLMFPVESVPLPIVQPWVEKVKVEVFERVSVAPEFIATALKCLSFVEEGETVVLVVHV